MIFILLCQELRQRIISVTSQNGGHVGPNLGVVELTIASHLAFESPKDSFCGMFHTKDMSINSLPVEMTNGLIT